MMRKSRYIDNPRRKKLNKIKIKEYDIVNFHFMLKLKFYLISHHELIMRIIIFIMVALYILKPSNLNSIVNDDKFKMLEIIYDAYSIYQF